MRIIYDTNRKEGRPDNKLKTTYKHIFISTIFTMKNNNLFRKFLALFLTGTMLAGVGCKDYDDDIDDINKKIDDLNAKVELKADASALQTISDKLKDVDFSKFVTDAELSQELAAYVKDADLEKKVGDLEFQTVTQVQDLIKGLQNEAQVKALIENQLKAADLWSKIGGEVKKGILEELAKNSELTTAVKNQAVAAVLAAITNDPAVKDIKTAISKIAGEEASEFVKEYMDVNNKAWIENVNSAAAEAVKNAESALSRQIISLISTQGYLKKSDLTAELGAFKQAIAQLQADVAALINRIQSLVNVPGTMDVSYGEAYTTMDFYKVGATPIGNGMVTLTYRVTPASLAKDLVDAYANGKATFAIVSEQIKTRAATATPAATITDVRFIEEGKFAVTATMSAEELGELYEKEDKWITLALSIENTVNPGTGAEDETASEVTNNVLSNFASIMPDEAQEIELGVYTKDEEPVAYDYATIEMPFNKQAVSKKTLLENTQLLASLDGGKTLMTLDNVNKLLGSKISIGAYTVTPKYYADASQSAEITDKTEIGKFILRVDNSKLVYDTKLATVDFRAAGVSGDVGKNVVCAHKIVINVDGKATTATIEAPQTYIITNQAGATFTFKETPKPLAWSYAFVKNGIAGQTATPEISDNIFGEIALVNDIDLPKDVTIEDIITLGNLDTDRSTVKVAGKEVDNDLGIRFTAFASQIAMGVKASVQADAYEWGKTYDIEYVYVYQNVDYKLKGQIAFGAAPAPVNYIVNNAIGYETKSVSKTWKDVYTANKAGFASEAEFAEAIFAATTDPATPAGITKLFNKANEKGKEIENTNGTEMTVTASTLKGVLNAKDITATGDKFEQKAEWTTWYGQKISVTFNYNVTIPDFDLRYNVGHVTDIAGVMTTVVEGLVNGTTNLWEWPNITLPTYFNEVDAEKYNFTFEVTSKDDKPNKGDKYAVVEGDKLDWSAANRNYVDIKAVVKIKDTNIQVASQPLRVEIQTPIKTLAQTKAIEVAYKTNEATTANMFENLQLIDADGKSWIEYNKDTKAWEAVTVGDGKTAYDVFQAKPEAAKNTAGIVFKMKSAEYADTPASDKDASAYIKITDNTLTYENNSATLLKDIIIKVTPSFTYQYGEITGEEMTITIKR